MSLLDDLSRGVQSVGDAVSKEAGKVSVQSQIGTEERAIWQIYSHIGYRALEVLSAGAIQDEKLSELAATITPHQEKLNELQRQLQQFDAPGQ